MRYVLADRVTVAHNAKVSLRPCHGDIESPLLAQEAHFILRVTTHRAYDYGFFFAALEPINRPEFKLRILLFQQAGEQR